MLKHLCFLLLVIRLISFDFLHSDSKNLEHALKSHIVYSSADQNNVGYIYVGGHEESIDESTWLRMQKAFEYYKEIKPLFIILELNTPGGEVFAAQKISDALREMDIQYNIPVVAVINNWAISAGAMLAYSCRFIAVVKEGIMGAAEPVTSGVDGQMVSASEKVNSALRADFSSRAAFFNRNALIAEAMVDKDLIIVKRGDKIVKLENESQLRLSEPDPDEVISPKGKLLTLNADQLMRYGVADILLLPVKLEEISTKEREEGTWPAKKNLLFQFPFFSSIPRAQIVEYLMDWKTKFFVFLASSSISSLLLMGLIIGAYLEFSNPGLSLPGIVAGLSLFFLIVSNYSLEIANWLEVIFILIGLLLLLIEIALFPTMGLLLVIGLIFLLVGIGGIFLPDIGTIDYHPSTQTINAAGEYALTRLGWLSGAILLSGVLIYLLSLFFKPKYSRYNPLVLAGNEQDASKGYVAGEDKNSLPPLGSEGIVLATLRPAGKIVILDKIYDAMSNGTLIESGEKIVVKQINGQSIIVQLKRDLL